MTDKTANVSVVSLLSFASNFKIYINEIIIFKKGNALHNFLIDVISLVTFERGRESMCADFCSHFHSHLREFVL